MKQIDELFYRLKNEQVQVPEELAESIIDALPDRTEIVAKHNIPTWLIALRAVSSIAAILCLLIGVSSYYDWSVSSTYHKENKIGYAQGSTLDIVRTNLHEQNTNNISYTSIKSMFNEKH